MKRTLSIVFVLVFVLVRSFAQTQYCDKIDGERIIKKQYLTISYNDAGKIPNYVGYFLTKQNLQGKAGRESRFYPEPSVTKKYQAKSSDYTNSGYDRGHMSPAADWHFSKSAMHDSFSLANICPQAPNLNRIYWKSIENEEREDISLCDTLFVISGEICALGTSGSELCSPEHLRSARTHGTSGTTIKNGVLVPTQFYKTIVGVRNHKVVVTAAWLFDNTNDKQPEVQHRTTIPILEALIGKDLYHGFWFNNR